MPVVPDPLASTVRPSPRASSMTSIRASMVAGSTSATESTSKSHCTRPTRPSSLSGDSAAAFARASATGEPASRAAWTIASSCACAASTGPASGALGHLRQRGQVLDEGVDAVGVRAVGQRAALGRGDDDLDAGLVEGVDRVGEELRLEVGGLLRGDAGDREGVGHRLGHRRREGADGEHGDDPAGEEERPAPEGGLAETVQQGGHEGSRSGDEGRIRCGSGWGAGSVRRAGRGPCGAAR